MSQSYFTRKLTGYLDYKGIPYLFRRFAGALPEARAAGWPGGIPAVRSPDGAYMWDTTDVIHHLELRHPEPAVLPPGPVQRFLAYALEDVADEWLYRPAVGSRWLFEENARLGGFELARDITHEAPVPADQAFQMVRSFVSASCEPFGVTAKNVGCWIEEVARPWFRVLDAHLAARPFLFGQRPSLADFAVFGGSAAHFGNDPLCRRWLDEDGPAVVTHLHRLMEPEDVAFGPWCDDDDVPETLVALLADHGRLYLPWVSRAASEGAAPLLFAGGESVHISATPFLREARARLLARYTALRCEALDAVLRRAGILSYYADHVRSAGALPSYERPPQPRFNRPFAPPWEAERPA
jgi:glutathione S-transferase